MRYKMEFSHISVMLNETVDGLNVKKDGIYVDGTTGGGGHSLEVLSRLNGSGKLFCFDRDPDAINACKERFSKYNNVTLINEKYSSLKSALADLGVDAIDGMMLDLGVSSHQLDTRERGFSYHGEAPLDMRMSQQGITAAEIVNTYSEKELANIFFIYADEKFSFKIAAEIIKRRETKPIETTTELADIVSQCYPNKFKRNGHPARKVFQALRIAVNDEMGEVEKGIEDAFSILKKGGRLSIITFHSIEDRLVKQKFASFTKGCTCPPDFPVCVCGNKPKAKLVNRKPIVASDKELENNQRSRSAKLRILEKL